MKESQMVALLGRPLTSVESENYKLYLKIATQTLESLICTSLCDQNDPKVYSVRPGYSTVFTDIFTSLDEVKVDGEVIEPSRYSPRQWDKRSAPWYNSIVFDCRFDDDDKEVEISASWGWGSIPSDLGMVLAGLFNLIGKKNSYNSTIQSKQVEDFRVTFKSDVDFDSEFNTLYGSTLAKYSQCDIPNVQHGSIC